MPGLVAGILGCVFGVIGIFALGLVFVPLALLCALVGFFRGIAGRSAAGFSTSVLAGVLALVGFATSPSLWLLAGVASLAGTGALVASQPSRPLLPVSQTQRITPAPVQDAAGVCVRESRGRVVIERRTVRVGQGQGTRFYEGTVTARLDQDASGGGKHIGAVAFTLFKPGPDCDWAYNQVVEGIDSGRIETVALGSTTLVHLVGVSFGGSGDNYTHFVLAPTPDGFMPAVASALQHSNMGGLHIGVLSNGHRPGVTIWDAIWDSGTHYSPHRYAVTFYAWSGTAFDLPRRNATSFEVDAEPAALPARLGWQGGDQTRQDSFARVVPR